MNLRDKISTEIDRRKIQKLIDDGVITPRELDEADVVDETGDDDESGILRKEE